MPLSVVTWTKVGVVGGFTNANGLLNPGAQQWSRPTAVAQGNNVSFELRLRYDGNYPMLILTDANPLCLQMQSEASFYPVV